MENNTVIFICFTILSSLLFSILINRLFLKFSSNLGVRNIDDKVVRWSTTSKPSFGGISFFIGFLFLLSLYPILFSTNEFSFDIELTGIIAASTFGFLAGLADDAYNTNPLLKSIAQMLCAIVLILTGTVIEISSIPLVNNTITFIWVVGMMNSINMLDNMDGITSIASIFALLGIVVVLFLQGAQTSIYFILSIGLIATLIGFLFYNWHPSKMYMGDTGSQFLGVLLAALSIKVLWNYSGTPINTSKQFILPALAFLVPLSDTTTVTINRLLKRTSPFVGGKDHTTHHLSYFGFSDQTVAFILAGVGLISLLLLTIAYSIVEWTYLFTTLFFGFAAITFVSLFLVTKITKEKSVAKNESKKGTIKKIA